MDRRIKIDDFPSVSIFNENGNFHIKVDRKQIEEGVFIYKIKGNCEQPISPTPVSIKWRMPSFNVKGVWKCGGIHDKRQQYDWELVHLKSRISVDAPVISIFGHDDSNRLTFACSDAINLLEMNTLLREEDNHLYCHLTLFSERHPAITHYETELRIDVRAVNYAISLQEVSQWWESFDDLKPHPIPSIATAPLYSTWYQFHQDLEEDILLQECKIAKDIGYELIILDDGWQTMDNNRGYDYTGDWQPDRFPDMAQFVEQVHQIGMKFGLWFSVPFCGKHSKAYKRFKGKFLTENHRWAPVFDPRYPEVRQYLIDTYVNALKNWKLDAFKLDFIDDFKVYPETELTKENGRDYANVNAAVDRLLTDVMFALRTIKPDIGIEFRQQYVGPALRKFGNMFRAFDCPNDAVSNRIRITDVKLLCGASAVHSDPQTWHKEEPVEMAALQILNGFYGVPQMSVHLRNIPKSHLNMVKFYTKYWIENKAILMDGQFVPVNPLGNYPILSCEKNGHKIIGIYDETVVNINESNRIDLLNAKTTDKIVLRNLGAKRHIHIMVRDCQGAMVSAQKINMDVGVIELNVPSAGMVVITNN